MVMRDGNDGCEDGSHEGAGIIIITTATTTITTNTRIIITTKYGRWRGASGPLLTTIQRLLAATNRYSANTTKPMPVLSRDPCWI